MLVSSSAFQKNKSRPSDSQTVCNALISQTYFCYKEGNTQRGTLHKIIYVIVQSAIFHKLLKTNKKKKKGGDIQYSNDHNQEMRRWKKRGKSAAMTCVDNEQCVCIVVCLTFDGVARVLSTNGMRMQWRGRRAGREGAGKEEDKMKTNEAQLV